MKIWCISDTHGLHGLLKPPDDVDMVIFAGDAGTFKNAYHNQFHVLNFITWFESLEIKHKIWIAGNHDTSIEAGIVKAKDLSKNSIYLEHESVEVEGIKIFGSPWTPWFYSWAFNAVPEKEKELWRDIPLDTQIIITHGPVRGMMDRCSQNAHTPGKNVGSFELFKKVAWIQPKLFVCGHIHENTEQRQVGNTLFVNAAVVNEYYKLTSNGLIINY